MRAAKMTERPNFSLMKQTDIQKIYHLQMPRWLFSDPRYAEMNLDVKVAYTFLLNRFQLSKKNGWVNDRGEVFVIFPRKALAKELRICEQRVTAAFKKLTELHLIWEKRCGRGDANQIYLAHVEPVEDVDYECTPFLKDADECDSRNADSTALADCAAVAVAPEPQKPRFQSDGYGDSRAAWSAAAEPQHSRPSNIKPSNTKESNIEVSPSVRSTPRAEIPDGRMDEEEELNEILGNCELDYFSPEVARVFENAIERLFYSDHFRIDNACLPRARIRSKLQMLDGMILRDVESKLRANTQKKVRNSTNYVCAVVLNCITESESDLLVDAYLNQLQTALGRETQSDVSRKHGRQRPRPIRE